MRKSFGLIIAFLSTVGLSGCALTTEQIDLTYVPTEDVQVIQEAEGKAVFVQVNDSRMEKPQVSAKKNGFGMELGKIRPKEDVAITLRRAVEQELIARGFSISDKMPRVLLSVDITRFWNDFKSGFWAGDAVADLTMSVHAQSEPGTILYSRNLIVQGIEENIQLATGSNAKLALDRALQKGVRMLFDDEQFLAALLNVDQRLTIPSNPVIDTPSVQKRKTL